MDVKYKSGRLIKASTSQELRDGPEAPFGVGSKMHKLSGFTPVGSSSIETDPKS